jgi:hypothetical protein
LYALGEGKLGADFGASLGRSSIVLEIVGSDVVICHVKYSNLMMQVLIFI